MERLRTFLNLVKQHPEAIEEIRSFLNSLEKEVPSSFINFKLLELTNDRNLPPLTRKFLLEYSAERALSELYITDALRIYSTLIKIFPNETYREKIEQLRLFRFLERYRFLSERYRDLNFETLQKIYLQSLERDLSVERILQDQYGIDKQEILSALEKFYELPAVDLRFLLLQKKLKRLPRVTDIKKHFFEENLAIPFEYEGQIYLFCYQPEDHEKIERVKRILQLAEVKLAIAFKEDILFAIEKYYKLSLEDREFEVVREEVSIEEEVLVDSTIVNLVNTIIEEAYRRRASDIHWESLTGKRGLLVRFRVDGECFEYTVIPEDQKSGCITRIKVMANLDIAERRLPQDGKIKFKTRDGKSFEIRVATLPTIDNNEDVVMRILGGIEFRSLEELDLQQENYETLKRILDLPYGLILCVGPTGSGKTTTLHACLKYLNRPNKKIWTAEDPVEIVQDGLRQVQVNPKIGLTFSKVLRAFLRADPDVIMIGETRDKETAHTLIEASLTGHLVLSTLHTNSAPETIIRLLGMGIDPFNFADSLLGIIAQRLAKRLCKKCKRPYTPHPEEIQRLLREYGAHPTKPLTEEMIREGRFYQPVGCEECNYTGFRGRIAIHELLVPDEEIRELIIRSAPAQEIRKVALNKGFQTLKQDGIIKVLWGETTLREVLRVTLR